jgi:dynactin complex subunit
MENLQESTEIPSEKLIFYQEFCKLLLYNKLLTERLSTLTEEKSKLETRFTVLQEAYPNGKRKRFRRNASQIKRIFSCIHCEKSYGSEASLKNHLKFKHSSLSSSET